MRFQELYENTPKTLYHGTLIFNLPAIEKEGLIPLAGDFTKHFYNDIDVPELVFATDKKNLKKALTAIVGHLNRQGITPTTNNLEKYGALVVLKHAENDFEKENEYTEYPTVEPGDYYSSEEQIPNHILTGKKMMRFFRKNGLIKLNESYSNIVPALTLIAREIIKNVFSIDDVRTVVRPFDDEFLDRISEYGKQYVALCDYINSNVPINFFNGSSGTFKGEYIHSMDKNFSKLDKINVYLGHLGKDIIRKNDLEQTNVMSTLVHELRHVMQRQEFRDFYHNTRGIGAADDTSTEYDYKTDPVEIDAAFTHHLYQTDLNLSLEDFVDAVMTPFVMYKHLTPKWERHYRKAAAKYYTQNHSKDIDKSSAKDRLEKNREKKINEIVNFSLDNKIDDLRDLGHPSEGRFLYSDLQSKINSLLREWLEDDSKFSETNNAILLAHLGILKTIGLNVDTRWIAKRYNQSIIENFSVPGFNRNFFIDMVKKIL